ncbi:hypothetical protein ACEOWJ_002507 [Bacillus cereus]
MFALQGYVLHYESAYLQERNWIQIACMNHYKVREIRSMLQYFKRCLEELESAVTF